MKTKIFLLVAVLAISGGVIHAQDNATPTPSPAAGGSNAGTITGDAANGGPMASGGTEKEKNSGDYNSGSSAGGSTAGAGDVTTGGANAGPVPAASPTPKATP